MGAGAWDWQAIGLAASVAVVCGLAGGFLTTIGPWYRGLLLPSWKPPDWAFGPVWLTIFSLAVISSVMAWGADERPGARRALLIAYGVNVVLNIAWSAIFFRMRRPDWAFVEVIALWSSVLSLIVVTAPMSTIAATLLLPYLAWVSVAAFLNLTIVRMNPSFAGR